MKNFVIIISLLLICTVSIYFIAADDTTYNIKLHEKITPAKTQNDKNVKNEDEIEDWPDDCEEDYEDDFQEHNSQESTLYKENENHQDNFEYNGYETNYEYEYNLPTYSDFRADPRR